MILILKLLLAHFVGDFVLQPDSWVKEKKEQKAKSPKLYLHILVHIGLMLLLVWDLRLLVPVLIIGALHLLIDIWKLYVTKARWQMPAFMLDQLLHLLVIVVIGAGVAEPQLNISLGAYQDHILLFALCLLMLTVVASKVIEVFISRWSPDTEDRDEDSLVGAGSYIGMLERLFVFGFIISGQVQAIGFLLAAKSVFRFGDLKDAKDRKLTEYILIGTLLSFGMAIMTGVMYQFVLNHMT